MSSAIRIALFFTAIFLILGLHLPYFPIWLDWVGLTSSEIALVTAMPLFLRLAFTPLTAVYADSHRAHRQAIIWLALAALVAGLALMGVGGFWLIFLVSVIFTLCFASMMPLIETIAVSSVKSDGYDYGRMRLWGSLAFIAAGFFGGWVIDQLGAMAIVPMLLAATVITMCAGWALPRSNVPNVTLKTQRTHAGASGSGAFQDVKRLSTHGLFLVFLLAVSAIQGAHGLFYTFGALHWKSQGLSTATVGGLWAIGVLAEVVLLAWSGWALTRVGAVGLIILGGAAAIVRWVMMSFDPGLAVLVPLQILHGATYGATHLGAIYFLARAVPETISGTAQALYAALAAGVATGAATLASGPLYDAMQGQGYVVMAGLAGVGLLAALALHAKWSGEVLWGEPHGRAGERETEIGPKLPVGPNL